MEPRPNSILRISDEKTLELIDLYEQEQCLWNSELEGYKSRAIRHQAAERIAAKMDIKHFSSKYVVIKFKNLRNSYCQELKKIASSTPAKPYKPKVFWFQKMDSFLRPHLHQMREPSSRQLTHEIIIKPEPADSEEFVHLSNPEDVFIGENDSSDGDDDDEEDVPRKRSRNSSSTSKRARYDESSNGSSELARSIKEIASHLQVMANQKEDFHDNFGKYVAATLRNMPLQRSMEVQSQIVNLLAFGMICKTDSVESDDKQE